MSVTDLAKRADLAYKTAHREVARRANAGILSERQVGRTGPIRGKWGEPEARPRPTVVKTNVRPTD